MTLPFRLHAYTYEEYRMLEASSATKHEFLAGEIYAMAGGTPLHAALAAAASIALGNQLAGTRCRVYSSDLRVRVQATGLATYPDLTIVCGDVETADEDRHAAINPRVVVEVLSDGTEAYDRGEKLSHYKQVPSLDAVVIISQTERRIETWQRESDGWTYGEGGPGQSVELRTVACSLGVTELYDAAGAP